MRDEAGIIEVAGSANAPEVEGVAPADTSGAPAPHILSRIEELHANGSCAETISMVVRMSVEEVRAVIAEHEFEVAEGITPEIFNNPKTWLPIGATNAEAHRLNRRSRTREIKKLMYAGKTEDEVREIYRYKLRPEHLETAIRIAKDALWEKQNPTFSPERASDLVRHAPRGPNPTPHGEAERARREELARKDAELRAKVEAARKAFGLEDEKAIEAEKVRAWIERPEPEFRENPYKRAYPRKEPQSFDKFEWTERRRKRRAVQNAE